MKTKREKLLDNEEFERIQKEAKFANQVQRDHPDISRTDALNAAMEFYDKLDKQRGLSS